MSQNRPNKVTVPVNSDAYNLTGDLATMADSTNVTVIVASTAERDALPGGSLKVGSEVLITNDTTLPKQKWNGTKWVQFIYAEASASTTAQPSQAWGSGQLTVSGTNSTDTSFVSFPTPDCIQFTAPGLYSMSAHMKLASGTVSGFTKGTIQDSTGNSVYGQEYPAAQAAEFVIPAPVIYFPNAGGQVFIKFIQSSGAAQTWNTIARISKIG